MLKGFYCGIVLCGLLVFSSSLFAQSGQWTQQPTPSGTPGLWAISMKDTGNGIAGGVVALGGGHSGVLRKVAGNPNWQTVPTTSFSPAIPGSLTAWYGVSAFPSSSTMYICGNNSKVYKSSDNGQTWSQQTGGMTVSKTLFGMFFKNTNTGMVVGDDGTAYYTNNGGTSWTLQSTGTTETLLAVHSAGLDWFVSGTNNTMLKFTPPSSWTTLSVAPHNPFAQALADVHFLSNSAGYTSGGNGLLNGNVLETGNGGSSWSNLNVPTPGVKLYNAIWFFSAGIGWAANTFDALYYTSNGGTNWNTHSAIPTIGLGGGVTELNFPSQDLGWASGGAIGGTGPTSGWVIKWTPIVLAPEISTADTLDFGLLSCASSKDLQFTVRNIGTSALDIPAGGFTFSAPEFSLLSPSLPQSIAAAAQTDFVIRWTPGPGFTGTIPPGTTLTISSNDPTNPNWVIVLEGTRNTKLISLASTDLQFSSICMGQQTDIIVTGTPVGAGNQFIAFVHASGDDGISVPVPPVGTVINGATDFTFRHTPTGSGTRSGSYYFISGDVSCPDTTIVTFSGEANQTAFEFPPSPLDFGPVCTEKFIDITHALQNTGTTPAQIIKREFVSGKDLFPDQHPGFFGPVQPGSSERYTFRFHPGQYDTGIVSGTYRFILGPCADTVVMTFTGYGVNKAKIQIVPTNVLVLGPTPVGGVNNAQVSVVNNTSVPVEIASARLIPQWPNVVFVNLPSFPQIIAPGASLVLDVRYTPTKLESINSDLCVVYSSPCVDSLCISVAASSSEPPAIVVAKSLDMGVQKCDIPIRDTLTVYNTGPGMLTITRWIIGGPQTMYFKVVEPAAPPLNIMFGDSAYIVVEYDSPVEGPSSAVLILEHNDPRENNQTTVSIFAHRELYNFEVSGDTLSTMEACFGSTAERTFVIRNTGIHRLDIQSIGLQQANQHFRTDIIALPQILDPGDTIAVTVYFDANMVGPATAVLSIVSEPCSFTRQITIEAEGLRSFMVFTPSQLDFGNVTAGSSRVLPVEFRNTGTRPLIIDSIALVPASSEFTVELPPQMPLTIGVGNGVILNSTYAPVTDAGISGVLCAYISSPCPDTLCTDVNGSSNTDVLAADKTEIYISLDPCTVNTACEQFNVKNFASNAHTVSAITLLQGSSIFSITSSITAPFTLNPNQEFMIEVCANGAFTGSDTATIRISTSTGASDVVVRVRATRDSARLIVPEFADFGIMAICLNSLRHNIVVTNGGSIDDTLEIIEDVSDPFSTVTVFPLHIPAFATGNITFEFSPSNVADYGDTLILRSRLCGRIYRVAIQASYLDRNLDISPDPLDFADVQSGTSRTLPLSVENLNLRTLRISGVLFSSPEFSTTQSFPIQLDSGAVLSIPVRFNPTSAQPYSATACVVMDMPCDDTVCVTLNGQGVEGNITISPSELQFDTLAQCELQNLEITVSNGGTSAVTLDSTSIIGSHAAAFRNIDPLSGPITLGPGEQRRFRIEFNPSTLADGPATAVFVAFTNSGQQGRLEVPMSGYRVSQFLRALLSLDFGSLTAGSPSSQTVSINNPGTATFTYTGANLPANVSITPAPPITLRPGESINIDVTITPLQSGSLNSSFALLATQPCIDSSVVNLTGTVSSGVSVVGAIAGPIASCDSAVVIVVFKNPLNNQVQLTDIQVTGTDAGFFSVQEPATPVMVPGNDSTQILLLLVPDQTVDRNYNVECVIQVLINGVGAELRATVFAFSYVPRIDLVTSATFTSVETDDPPTVMVSAFINNTAAQIVVTDAQFTNPVFAVVSTTPPLSAVLAPGDTLYMTLQFAPSAIGNVLGELVLSYMSLATNGVCSSTSSTSFTGTGLPPNVLDVDLSIEDFHAAVDERIRIPVQSNTNLGSEGIDGWYLALQFNKWMLHPNAVVKEGSLSTNMDVSMDYIFEDGRLELRGMNAPLINGTGDLVAVEFLVLIGNAEHSILHIEDSVWLNTTKEIQLTRKRGSFTLSDFCFADGKRLILTDGRNFLYPAVPNPFATSTTIEYEIATDGYVEILVMNSMGEPVARLVEEDKLKGVHRIVFNAENLPSGMYFVMMTKDSFRQSRTVIISK
jgi:photosynthesis system II assembly factor YCF48-like protein